MPPLSSSTLATFTANPSTAIGMASLKSIWTGQMRREIRPRKFAPVMPECARGRTIDLIARRPVGLKGLQFPPRMVWKAPTLAPNVGIAGLKA